MATKKGTKRSSKKKATPKKTKNAAPEKADKEDMLILQIAVTTRENTMLKHQLAQSNVEKLTEEQKQMDAQYQRLTQQINEKYNLTPGKDKLDVLTGIITRG